MKDITQKSEAPVKMRVRIKQRTGFRWIVANMQAKIIRQKHQLCQRLPPQIHTWKQSCISRIGWMACQSMRGWSQHPITGFTFRCWFASGRLQFQVVLTKKKSKGSMEVVKKKGRRHRQVCYHLIRLKKRAGEQARLTIKQREMQLVQGRSKTLHQLLLAC